MAEKKRRRVDVNLRIFVLKKLTVKNWQELNETKLELNYLKMVKMFNTSCSIKETDEDKENLQVLSKGTKRKLDNTGPPTKRRKNSNEVRNLL